MLGLLVLAVLSHSFEQAGDHALVPVSHPPYTFHPQIILHKFIHIAFFCLLLWLNVQGQMEQQPVSGAVLINATQEAHNSTTSELVLVFVFCFFQSKCAMIVIPSILQTQQSWHRVLQQAVLMGWVDNLTSIGIGALTLRMW
jgi:hypothetical protein